MKFVFGGLAVMLCCSCSPSPVEGGQPTGQPSGTYVHQATGFTFPPTLGKFKRSAVTEFNSDATDVSAGYDLVDPQNPVAITIYVYPAPRITSIGSPQSVIDDAQEHMCSKQFQSVKSDIERAHPGARLVSEGPIPSPSETHKNVGKKAVYDFQGVFAGREQPLRSEADLYCYVGGPWLIAYRSTSPVNAQYQPALANLMHNLAWPANR